jgi:hypothetical protein
MNEKYVAMDVHKASVAIGVRDAAGKYIMESIVETKETRFSQTHIGPEDLSDHPGHVEERRTIRS